MKRRLLAITAIALLFAGSGCNRQFINRGCVDGSCGGRSRPTLFGHAGEQIAAPGPTTAQVAYPYYTVRGPRDYFCNDPPSIGPN